MKDTSALAKTLDHVAEMFRLKGGKTHRDIGPRTASRLAILPNVTHVTLMQRAKNIVPMTNDFIDLNSYANKLRGKMICGDVQ